MSLVKTTDGSIKADFGDGVHSSTGDGVHDLYAGWSDSIGLSINAVFIERFLSGFRHFV